MRDRLSVLVVDDDPDTAASLATLLDLLGYATRAACGGVQALEVTAQELPDVVILGLLMRTWTAGSWPSGFIPSHSSGDR